jgi:gas vesicle protein
MNTKGYWISFVVGVSAGAAVALLYAPATGVRTRKRIGRSFDESIDTLNDAADYLKDQAESLRKQTQATLKQTRGKVEDVVEKASDAVQSVVKSVHALQ